MPPAGSAVIIDLRSFQQRRDFHPNDELAAKTWLEERIEHSRNGVFSEVVDLTPALAAELLKRNAANRPVRKAKLKQYTGDMKADRWQLNGEAIIMSDTGEMNEGQHRCLAVLNAMRVVKTVFVFGVGRDTRKTIDTGATRAAHDFLTIEGHKYANLSASATRLIIGFRAGAGQFIKGRAEVSTTAIIDAVIADHRIGEAAAIVFKMAQRRGLVGLATPAVFTLCYYLFAKKNPGLAYNYLSGIKDPSGLPTNHPAAVVSRQLRGLDGRREAHTELIIRGWNALREGLKEIGQIPLLGQFPKVK